jgi:hypothetical protein
MTRITGWDRGIKTLRPVITFHGPADDVVDVLATALPDAGLRIGRRSPDGFVARRRDWLSMAWLAIGADGDLPTTTVKVRRTGPDTVDVEVRPARQRQPNGHGVIDALNRALDLLAARGDHAEVGGWHRG